MSDLVIEFQQAEDHDYWTKPTWFEGTQDEYDRLQDYYWREYQRNIINELNRRERVKDVGIQGTSREILEAVKERVAVADVLAWYTEVLYSDRQTLKYRCSLHGDGVDRTPSGVIYVNENRWHCFVCGKGGDVIEAVQQFEKLDFPHALGKLARYSGIDTRALRKIRVPTVSHRDITL